MRYLLALLAVAVTLVLVTARPRSWDIRERVERELEIRGISLDKLPQETALVKDVGDIWSDCGDSSDIGKIVNVVITPDPPKKGENLTVKAEVTLSEEVTSGSLAVKLSYTVLFIPITVIDETYDLCGEETGLQCPLKDGQQSIELNQEIPSSAPGGKYTGKAVATSSDGKQIVCIDLEFQL